jgi:hypothetical protein
MTRSSHIFFADISKKLLANVSKENMLELKLLANVLCAPGWLTKVKLGTWPAD